MTLHATPRNPASAIIESLERDHRITFMQAGDNDTLCSRCMVPIIPTRTGWQHDPEAIRRLRAMALEGTWPR